MELGLAPVLATALLFGLLVLFGGSQTRGPSDVLFLFLLVFSLFYGLRPLLFVLGLDTPQPDNLFPVSSTSQALTTTVIGISVYLLMTMLGCLAVTRSGLAGWGPFFVDRPISVPKALRLTIVVTVLATVISTALVVRFGGMGELVRAAKFDKALAGLFVLRIAPSIGAVLALSTFLEAYAVRARRWVVAVALLCAFLNAFYVFLWGTRSLLVVIGACIVLGLRRRSRSPADPPSGTVRRRVLPRLVMAVILVITLAGGLRVVRDQMINGEVQQVYAQASMWRQISVGTNAVYFDAAMLAFRDWPQERGYRNGADFKVGALGLVPRAVWQDKPDAVAPGRWFRQVYQPTKVNGWPMGTAGLWYLNFGWWGVLVGGLASGLVLGAVVAAQRRRPDNGFNTVVAVVCAVYVIGLGWDSDLIVRGVLWLLPLWWVGRHITTERAPSGQSRWARLTRANL